MYIKAIGLKKITKTIKISEKSKRVLDKISKKDWQFSDSDIISNNLENLNIVLEKIDTINLLLGLEKSSDIEVETENLVSLYNLKELGNIATLNNVTLLLEIDFAKTKRLETFINIQRSSNYDFKYFIQRITVITESCITSTPWGGSTLYEEPKQYTISNFNIINELDFVNLFWKELLEFTINKTTLNPKNLDKIKFNQ